MDHNNLRYYLSPQWINQCVVRYLSDLSEYNYHLVHQPGKLNKADALSQPPGAEEGKHDNEDVLVLPQKLFVRAAEVSTLEQQLWDDQGCHPEHFQELRKSHPIESINHHWLHQGQPVVVLHDLQ
jgi:hypothetical protein